MAIINFKDNMDQIINELNDDSMSPTLDKIMVEFIKFNMEVYMNCNGGATMEDSIDYIQGEEFIETIKYYMEMAIKTIS